MTPGKSREGVVLCSNGRVIFHGQDGTRTPEHGCWHKWMLKNGTHMQSMTFNHKGNEAYADLHTHTLYKVVAGVYRNVTHWQILILQHETSEPEENKPLLLNVGDKNVSEQTIKHKFLWLHLARPPAVVLLPFSGQIVFHVKLMIRRSPQWKPSVNQVRTLTEGRV